MRPGAWRNVPPPPSGRNDQMEALRDAQKQELVTRANWIWEADVDEFLRIHAGDGALAALADACGAPQAISLRDQVFANDGVQSFEDRPVIEQFIHSHNPDLWCAGPGIKCKALVQNDFSRSPLRRTAADLPRRAGAQGPATRTRQIRRLPAPGAWRHATLNHNALRSLESYLVKSDRGDVNRAGRVFDAHHRRARYNPA